ncbi:uncharacterized protein MONBRDRAFT_22129 [Monosiga brevicollis MX1]|uniref:Calmodulin n=1 Tax=Monosiga brevicollis TaxID=81824 RepID=A9UPN1_MONBE|nr:uncharacterized protein MONBRDRAFT_22129 [Monosiga brevicollis MX1]EDQ92900.1 predicted protein [Monosiga brevicollis MX1]|eukprot:XP_001742662.1 hypothetical protein [Monosiga brevicollis MX1]
MGRAKAVNKASFGQQGSSISVSSQRSDDDRLASRRAMTTVWRSEIVPARKSMIGEPLPHGWAKALTDSGTPYYINHETRVTQWVDPRLQSCLQELSAHDDIRLAAYRTAIKLRDVQVYLRMSQIKLPTALNAFYALDVHSDYSSGQQIDAEEMAVVLMEMYADLPHPQRNVEVMISMMLKIYDRNRSGHISLQAFQTALTLLSVSWIEEKYRFLFTIYDTNQDDFITVEQLTQLLRHVVGLPNGIREAYAFCPTKEFPEQEAHRVFELERERNGAAATQISLNTFVNYCMTDPRPLLWLPVMHRVAATENSKHETTCCVCKMYPIIGFRYKNMTSMDRDVCQECYWTGREGNGHKASHEVKEYCFSSTARQDAKDFFGRIKRKMTKKKADESEAARTARAAKPVPVAEPRMSVAVPYEQALQEPAEGDDVVDHADVGLSHGVAGLQDEHDLIQEMAAQLKAADDEGGPVSTMVVNLETEQKLHLLRVIDELDAENRQLLQRLMDSERDRVAELQEPVAGDEGVRDAMQGRINDLNERNRDLVDQLTRLQAMLVASGMAQGHDNDNEQVNAPAYELARAGTHDDMPIYERAAHRANEYPPHTQLQHGALQATNDDEPDISLFLFVWKAYDPSHELAAIADSLSTAFADLRAEVCPDSALRYLMAIAFTPCLAAPKPTEPGHCLDEIKASSDAPTRAPRRSLLNSEERRELWGAETAAMLEEQDQYGNTPLPRDTIKRQKNSIRSASFRLRARLGRLASYSPDPASMAQDFVLAASPMPTPGRRGSDTRASDASPPLRARENSRRSSAEGPPPPPALTTSTPRVYRAPSMADASPDASGEGRIARHAATVRRPDLGERRLSDERLGAVSNNFESRVLASRARVQQILGVQSPDVTEANAVRDYLTVFSDGYLFCLLANHRLRERKLTQVKPYRSPLKAYPSAAERLTPSQVVENFNMFHSAWRTLGFDETRVPTWGDITHVAEEVDLSPQQRRYSLKVLEAVETLLALSESKA